MNKHPFLKVGAVLSIIVGACSIFLSFFYMSISSNENVIYRYLGSFLFFISIIVVLSAILSKRISRKPYDEITKTFNILSLIFQMLMIVLSKSFFNLLNYQEDGFIITFLIFLCLTDFFAFFFSLYGIIKTNKKKIPDNSEKLEKLKELLDKKLITEEEYEQKRKDIISSL